MSDATVQAGVIRGTAVTKDAFDLYPNAGSVRQEIENNTSDGDVYPNAGSVADDHQPTIRVIDG